MHRFACSLVLALALLGLVENAQGQSGKIMIEPAVRPQLELEAGDDKEVFGLDEATDDVDLDLDEATDEDESNAEQDLVALRRVTDEQIRNNWPKHSIREIGLSLDQVGRVPEDRSGLLQEYGRFGPVSQSVKVFAWEAPDIRYQPLFFEDVVLERYGQTLPDYRQSVRSAIHFGTAFTGLSLQLLETPSRSCDYSLGYCRPGTCVPQTTQRHFFGPLSLQ